LGHQVGEQEVPDRGALAVRVDEVATAAVVEVKRVDTETIHLPVALVDEPLTFTTQGLEVVRQQDALEDEEALFLELASVVGRDARNGDGHGCSSCLCGSADAATHGRLTPPHLCRTGTPEPRTRRVQSRSSCAKRAWCDGTKQWRLPKRSGICARGTFN
jgi:hypothetical protein